MGEIYSRPDSEYLWLWYYDARGVRHRQSCKPLRAGQEQEARKLLKHIERQVRAEQEEGFGSSGPVTVSRWAEKYLERLALKSPGAVIDQKSTSTTISFRPWERRC